MRFAAACCPLLLLSVLVFACGSSSNPSISGGADAGDGSAPLPSATTAPPGTPPDASPPNPKDAGTDAADGGNALDNLNTGDTSGTQAAAGKPGGACGADQDCDDYAGADPQSAVCLLAADGFPGGYCSFFTDNSVNLNYGCNGTGGKHVPLSAGFGDGYCAHPCAGPSDCRVGYRCAAGACQPNCLVANYTCLDGTCSQAKGVCGP